MKHPPPKNCKQFDPPKLNDVIRPIVSDALSSVVETFSMVVKSLAIPERQAVLEKFDDTMILIADLQHDESVISRNLILANLDNKMKEPLSATPITGNCLEMTWQRRSKQLKPSKRLRRTSKKS